MNGQKPEPYTQWGLPPGAKARLGKGGIGRIRYSPDGTQLSTTGPIGIWLYDVHTCTEVALLKSEQNLGTGELPLSWTGTTLVNLNWDDTISLWDIHNGHRRINPANHTEEVYDFALSPDGKMLASGSDDQTIRLWDAQNGRHLSTLTGHEADIWMLAFSPNGIILASRSTDKTICLWDVATGKKRETFTNLGNLGHLVFSRDGTILLWDVQNVGNTY